MNTNIIKGYKGIIDLDISNIPEIHRKEIIKKHHEDIEEYKKYQETLRPEYRYENTIEKIQKLQEKERKILDKHIKEEIEEKYKLYKKFIK